jgi:hypothetical protein
MRLEVFRVSLWWVDDLPRAQNDNVDEEKKSDE